MEPLRQAFNPTRKERKRRREGGGRGGRRRKGGEGGERAPCCRTLVWSRMAFSGSIWGQIEPRMRHLKALDV
jgi:hypothetical protein